MSDGCVRRLLQWLVKRAIETREEMGDYVRAYSVSQFHKTHSMPEVRLQGAVERIMRTF